MNPAESVRLCTSDGVFLSAQYFSGVSDAPAYVLGHGFTGSASRPAVTAVSERLNRRGAAVLALDFRGHGTSEGLSTVGVDEVADVSAAVQYLRLSRPGLPVISLGFSMGASVVIRQAGGASGASGLGTEGAGQWLPDAVIAVSGPGHWYERGTAPMRRVHLGLETWVGRMALRWSFRTRIGTGWDLLPVSPVEVAGAIAAPLLVVHGDADPYFGLEHPRMIAAVAPRADLWIERGMGHGETAMIPALLDRIDDWARTAVGAGSATMAE